MKRTRRIGVAALLLIVVALLLLSEGMHDLLVRMLAEADQAAAAHPLWAMLLVVAFSALAAMLAFVSSWIVVPFAVYTWGTAEALLLLWTGWLIGGAGTYAIGRFLGRPAARWLVSAPVLARYEERISHRTPFGIVLLAQFALPSELPGYVLGVVRYPFARYLGALGIVELTYGIATIYLGTGIVQRRAVPVIAGLAALAVITAWTAYTLGKRLAHERHTAASMESYNAEGNVSGTSPRSHSPVRSKGSTARVVS
jgi:uncharacterized membrane protein YdjX (TVP38/TMEM64 family)